MVEHEFAEVIGAALRADRPDHISEVLQAEAGGGLQGFGLELDFNAARFALDFEFAVSALHQVSAEEGTRTPTPLRAHGPEPCASASSATSASEPRDGYNESRLRKELLFDFTEAEHNGQNAGCSFYCAKATHVRDRVRHGWKPCPSR